MTDEKCALEELKKLRRMIKETAKVMDRQLKDLHEQYTLVLELMVRTINMED